MELLLAVQFLTRIPFNICKEVGEKNLARSMAYYPFVGIMLGLLAGGLYFVLTLIFPSEVSILFVIIFLIAVSGNLHGDGLMDTVDGIFSGRDRERMLEIMKDSSVGAHGVMAAVLVIISKLVLLGHIPAGAVLFSLILMLCSGRWGMVFAASFFTYPRGNEGTGNFTVLVGKREMFWSTATFLAASLIILGWRGIFFAAIMLSGAVLLSLFISRKLGGMTGDTMGALSECLEVLALSIMVFYFNIGLMLAV